MSESELSDGERSVLPAVRMIRQRPAMFIGDTGQPGVNHLLFEVFSNCVDQFCAKHATESRIEIEGRTVRVSDDGEGMPFDMTCRDGLGNVATKYLTNIHYTGTADGHTPHVHVRGLHGVGLVAVNALSESYVCRAWRRGKLWEQKFIRGVQVADAAVIQEGCGRGTTVEFIPDPEIFGRFQVDAAQVRGAVQETAYLHPGLRVHFQTEHFHFPDGLAELVRSELPQTGSDGPVFSVKGRTGDVEYFAAAAGTADGETNWRTWCNGFPLYQHGSNKIAFVRALRTAKYSPAIAVIHVLMHDPRFTSPNKGLLNNPEIEKPLAAAIRETLIPWCKENRVGKYSG
ncbi:MAG: ATP-binding protein [Planctomycetaceae bacterium]